MSPYYADDAITLHHGHALDVLRTLPDDLSKTYLDLSLATRLAQGALMDGETA